MNSLNNVFCPFMIFSFKNL